LIIHYDPTEEKGRVFGASHVILPTNEEAREKKITELKSMTEETNKERLKRKKQRSAKKEEERRRLNRLRQRFVNICRKLLFLFFTNESLKRKSHCISPNIRY
jgi:hypothetical protein